MTDAPVSRIVLVDDHTLFRKGLAELLEREGAVSVAAITGNPEEVPDLLRQYRPNVLLLDLNLGGADGINVMQQLRSEGFDVRGFGDMSVREISGLTGLTVTGDLTLTWFIPHIAGAHDFEPLRPENNRERWIVN